MPNHGFKGHFGDNEVNAMSDERDYWLREFDDEKKVLEDADEIILYGKTPVLPLIKQALSDIRGGYALRTYDSGKIENEDSYDPNCKQVVILCGMQKTTRMSMRQEADRVFAGSPCYSFLAIYYVWLTEYIHRPCDCDELARTFKSMDDGQCIPNLDSIITTYCNLDCVECSNGIPYRKEKKHINMDKQINDLNLITGFRPVSYCNIQGGEPLMNPLFANWVRQHAENPKIAFITVATNGTIVPSDDACIAMRESGAIFRISNYGEISSKIDGLIKAATSKKVPCDIYARAKSWVVCGELKRHGRNEANNRELAASCMFGKNCIMLYDGNLYCCCRTLFSEATGVNNDDTLVNTLCIDNKITLAMLDELVSCKNLYRMCDYCDFPMSEVKPAVQMRKR